MESPPTAPAPRKPLRLWPGVVLAGLLVLVRFVLPLFTPDVGNVGVMVGVLAGPLIVLWWLFFSRAAWADRLGALGLMIVALFATYHLVDKSIRTGAMGFLFFVLAVPMLALAFVAWAVATRNLPDRTRRITMAATILLACGAWTLVRTGGFTGDFDHDFAWRWSPTAEERLLATEHTEPAAPPAASEPSPQEPTASAAVPATSPSVAPATPASETPPATPATDEPAVALAPTPKTGADWPGFRGPHRD